MASKLDKMYASSPVWLQNIGISAYGLMWRNRRFGGKFSEYVSEYIQRESNTAEEWRIYQTEQLRLLLIHAKRNVPYYTGLFKQLGFNEEDLAHFSLEDLPNLPVLEKEQIRSQPELFLAKDIPIRRLNKYYTSGTTGTPLAIYYSADMEYRVQAAYEARIRRWAGVNYQMSRGMIGGRIVVPKANAKPPFWRYNIFEKQLYLSAFHISPVNATAYASVINRYKPDYLVGYASSHYFLARMFDELGIPVYKPKSILTSSEKLTIDMRKTLEKVYQCEVFDGYSGLEACCQASECENHGFHISPDIGIVEFIDEDGNPTRMGEPGQLIATGLLNFAQPLIRYCTGDVGVVTDELCNCGRQMPILKELIGRLEDTVIGSDGRETVRFHGIFVGIPSIKEGQIIQHTLKNFTLRLVVNKDFNVQEKETIYQRFTERLGDINLSFEFVDRIDRSESGKFKAVISKVSRKSAPQKEESGSSA